MNSKQFSKLVSYLVKNYQAYATQEENGRVVIDELRDPKKVILDGRLPFYSWKRFFVPECESLFEYDGVELKVSKGPHYTKEGQLPFELPFIGRKDAESEEIALLGISLLDLKYIVLYERVFSNDPYYQKRRQNILIVGHNFLPEPENNLAHTEYKEENLKQYAFDIFLAAREAGASTEKKLSAEYQVFAGSEKGEKVLREFGYKDYQRVECLGSLSEDRSDSAMNVFRDKLKNHHNPKIWEELGKRCIECGKCTIACPTCFCFRIDDAPSLEAGYGQRQRCWDSCFYQEFSEVAGPSTGSGQAPKFLKTTAEKIHFWYYHKFARIPDEYSIAGCVGCHRCYQVCPVEIDIKKVLQDIANS